MFPTKGLSATSPITGCVHSVCLFVCLFFVPSLFLHSKAVAANFA